MGGYLDGGYHTPMKPLGLFALLLVAMAGWPSASMATDVLTYHNDVNRSGWNPDETALTPATVASSHFRAAFTVPLDSISFTQPLVATGVETHSGALDLLLVGTQLDSLYALNAKTGALVWRRVLVSPGATPVPDAVTGCPSLITEGIISTPVIDRSRDTVYAVSADLEGTGSRMHIHYFLHALSLGSGASRRAPVDVTASISRKLRFDADVETQRPALLESDGKIYVAFGGTCDYNADTYHGWVFAYDATTLAPAGVYVDTPTAASDGTFMAGIWMSGNGLAASPDGDVFLVTGNGHFDARDNFGDSVVALPPNLSHVLDFFTPDTVASDNASDADFGSGGLMLLPDPPNAASGVPSLVVAQGKDGIFTMMDRTHLGRYHPGKDAALAEINLGGTWSSPAYFDGGDAGESVFSSGGPLYRLRVTRQPVSLKIVGQTNEYFSMDNGNGATPSISSNGELLGSAVVWIVQWNNGPMRLLAYRADNLTHVLFSHPIGSWSYTGTANSTFVPTIANGRVYVVGDKTLYAFSLR
jgi:outer membrane protein assembly factor BamB